MKNYIQLLSMFILFCMLCSCSHTPSRTKLYYHDLTKSNVDIAEIDDVVLSRRVILERGQETLTSIYFLGTKQKEVKATSGFGVESEIANVNCIIEGLREAHPYSNIIPTAEFWKAIGNEVDTINLVTLLNGNTSKAINNLRLDYLVIAYDYLIDVDFSFHEDIIHGGYSDTDREVTATVTIDMRNKQIISAMEVVADHKSFGMHILIIPLMYGVSLPDKRPCVVAGNRAMDGITQLLGIKTNSNIAVVAATENPYQSLLQSLPRKLDTIEGCLNCDAR